MLEKYLKQITHLLNTIARWVIVSIMALVVLNILLRVLFKRPILGTYEYVGFLTAMAIGLSLAYCALQKGHIAIGFLVDKLPSKTQDLIALITNAAAFLFLSATSWHLFRYARRTWLSGAVSPTTETPFYFFIYLVGLGLSAFCLVLLVELIKTTQKVMGK